jgi:hypothetical protein
MDKKVILLHNVTNKQRQSVFFSGNEKFPKKTGGEDSVNPFLYMMIKREISGFNL